MAKFADGQSMDDVRKASSEDKVPLRTTDGIPVATATVGSGVAAVQPWSTELCHCFHDMPSCVENTLPIYWFQNSRQYNLIANQDSGIEPMSCLVSFGADVLIGGNLGSFILTFFLRGKLRERYNIQGSPVADCLLSYFCLPLVVCQNYREMSVRGEWPGGLCASEPFKLARPAAAQDSTIS